MKTKDIFFKLFIFLLFGFTALVFSPKSAKADTSTMSIGNIGTITYTYSVSKSTYLRGEPVIVNGIVEAAMCANTYTYTMGMDAQLNVPWENRDNVNYLPLVEMTTVYQTADHKQYVKGYGSLQLNDLVVGEHVLSVRLLYLTKYQGIKIAGYRYIKFKVLPSLPVTTTSPVTNITSTSATGGGNVTSGTIITTNHTRTFNYEGFLSTLNGPTTYNGQYTWKAGVNNIIIKVWGGGGGGGGGATDHGSYDGGGGGGGGLITSTVAVIPGQTYYIKVGKGGTGGAGGGMSGSPGTAGEISWFSSSVSGSNTDVYVSALGGGPGRPAVSNDWGGDLSKGLGGNTFTNIGATGVSSYSGGNGGGAIDVQAAGCGGGGGGGGGIKGKKWGGCTEATDGVGPVLGGGKGADGVNTTYGNIGKSPAGGGSGTGTGYRGGAGGYGQVVISYSENQTNSVDVSGIVWSTSENPTTDLSTKTTDGWKIEGPWTSNMTGLTPNTLYHVRAYATNSTGTAYGNDMTFTTLAFVPNATPLVTNATINPKPVNANGVTSHTITVTATDANGGNDIASQYALVNYQGANAGAHRGYIGWSKQNFPWISIKGTSISCGNGSGGTDGLAGRFNGFGDTYITDLKSCTTSVSGNTRTTTFEVSFAQKFATDGPATNNTLSSWAADLNNSSDAWRPFDVFDLNSTSFSSLPDLTAGSVTPSTVTAGISSTFSSTISNIGITSASGTITHLFQYDDDNNHDSGVTNSTTTSASIISGGTTTISNSHTFTSGTRYVRVCADADSRGPSDTGATGTIAELNENNNCGSLWTAVTVTTIPADSCGGGSGSTPQNFEPIGVSACARGDLNSNSPADITTNGLQAWRWSCGTVTTCTAPQYGCTTTTDTNYNSTGPNNTSGCANTCLNNAPVSSYPTCIDNGDCADGFKNGDETSADKGGRCSNNGGSCANGYTGFPNCTKKKPIFIED